MAMHQNDTEDKVKNDKEKFNKILAVVSEVLGKDAFYNIDYEKLCNKLQKDHDRLDIVYKNVERIKIKLKR